MISSYELHTLGVCKIKSEPQSVCSPRELTVFWFDDSFLNIVTHYQNRADEVPTTARLRDNVDSQLALRDIVTWARRNATARCTTMIGKT